MRKTLFSIAMLFLVGCGSADVQEFTGADNRNKISVRSGVDAQRVPSDADRVQANNFNRRVVYDAHIDLVVDNFSTFSKQLPQLVSGADGYIADVSWQQKQDFETNESYRTGTWKLKIRSQSFTAFVSRLSDVAFVEKHNQTAQDVTAEFVDLEARLVNKKRMEARVLDLMNTSQRSLSEVIKLEKELSRIREEIERMEGRLNLMRNRTEYATLTITALEKRKQVAATPVAFGQRLKSSWYASTALLTRCVEFVSVVAAAIFPWIVVFAIVATIGYGLIKITTRWRSIAQ